PQFHRLWRHMLEIRGGFRVSRQQSDSADNRPDTTSQNGAETPATKAASEAKKHWLDYATAFLTLAAAGGAITAAVFTGWQATTADQGLRDSNRAYVHSTNFRFVHYGAKNENGRTQWLVSPLIENTGSTGTRGMLMNTMISSAGEADFASLEKGAFTRALILPHPELTGRGGAAGLLRGAVVAVIRGGAAACPPWHSANGRIFSGTSAWGVFAAAGNPPPLIGRASPPVSRSAFAASPARRTIAKTTSAVRIGTRVPPRSQAGGPREAICAVRRGSLPAAGHNADAHVTRGKLRLGDAKATYLDDAAPLR